jgi:hypothetical protein
MFRSAIYNYISIQDRLNCKITVLPGNAVKYFNPAFVHSVVDTEEGILGAFYEVFAVLQGSKGSTVMLM